MTSLPAMLTEELREHFAAGVSIIVGTVSATGQPLASRGYGVVPVSGDCVHTFLDALDVTAVDNVTATRRLAVTTGDPRTFQSVQLKGAVEAIMPSTVDEHDEAVAHMRRFWDRVTFEDNLSREAAERGTPTSFVTCTLRIETMFDQAPGPAAGRTIAESPL